MFHVWRLLIVLIGFGLSGCVSIKPNQLSAADTAALHFTSVEVRVPNTAKIRWSAMEDEYVRLKGFQIGDPAPVQSPEARAYLGDQAQRRLRLIFERLIAERQPGTRPVRLVATFVRADIPSVAQRILVGGHPRVDVDVDVVDARTGVVLTTYSGAGGTQMAGQGVGALVDAALVAGGMDDLFERAADDHAREFRRWLVAN